MSEYISVCLYNFLKDIIIFCDYCKFSFCDVIFEDHWISENKNLSPSEICTSTVCNCN